MKEEKKKWVMPKFLPYKYDVKLINEDKVYMHIYVMKALVFYFTVHSPSSLFSPSIQYAVSQVISDVPADSLYRTERPPTKEIMRYFIRHKALRLGMGESSPWVVEEELVKKFNLPSKLSDFLLHPHKVKPRSVWFNGDFTFVIHLFCFYFKFLAENPSVKRKSLTSPEGRARKKHKNSITSGKDSENEVGDKKKKDSNMPLSPFILGSMQVSFLNCDLVHFFIIIYSVVYKALLTSTAENKNEWLPAEGN